MLEDFGARPAVEAALQIKQRFPIQDEILKGLTFLNPETINSTSAMEVTGLASKFPNIIADEDLHQIDHEWREVQFLDTDVLSTTFGRRQDVVTFWANISKTTDTCTSEESRFPTISKLTASLLAFPHSNAEVERVFLQIVLYKTKTRNRLKPNTLNSLLQNLPCSHTG